MGVRVFVLASAVALALAGPCLAAAALPPPIDAAIAEAARSPVPEAISAAVIESIAARPELLEAIVLRATRAAPAYSARIAADAARAYPAFAARIAAAASAATPEQAETIILVTSAPRVAAADAPSASTVKSAVEASPAIADLDESNWRIRLALGGAAAPEYDGAENYEFRFFPLVDIRWGNRFFVRANGGLTALTSGMGATGAGWNVFASPNWQIGPRLTLDYGRDNDLDNRLNGTRTIDPEIELGVFADFYSGHWNIGGDIRQGVGLDDNSHEGLLAELHVGWAARLSRRERIFTGFSTTYAGPSYMNTYYDKGAFDADANLRDAGAYVVLEGDLTEHVFARMEARGKWLLFDAADSPVTDPDSEIQLMGILQVGYGF
jgi:outer membrane scaffolding protein for murein synthesis (MipA/OmpV family)